MGKLSYEDKQSLASTLKEVRDQIKKMEWLDCTNEQYFLNWLDSLNKESVRY